MTKRIPSFSEAEDLIIKSNLHLSAPKLLALLPGREKPAVQKRRRYLMNEDRWHLDNEGEPWSDEDKDTLRDMFENEESHAEMGIALKRSEDAVLNMCRRLKLIRGRIPEDFSVHPIRDFPALPPNAFEDQPVGRWPGAVGRPPLNGSFGVVGVYGIE